MDLFFCFLAIFFCTRKTQVNLDRKRGDLKLSSSSGISVSGFLIEIHSPSALLNKLAKPQEKGD